MKNKSNLLPTKEDLILMLWEECRSESVGEPELIHIQEALLANLGAVESPARIARVLADQQVRLRHPAVLAADLKWRERQISESPVLRELNFDTIENAISSMKQLEGLRRGFASEEDEGSLQIVVEQARDLKLQLPRKPTEVSKEIVQWLAIWLQNPDIFEDWSDLRQNSPEFRERFPSSE